MLHFFIVISAVNIIIMPANGNQIYGGSKMEQNDSFKMTYSASRQTEIENIRRKYLPKDDEEDKMTQIRRLDSRAEQRAVMLSIVTGILGTLILGCGMSLILSDFGKALGSAALPIGFAVGALGLVLAAIAYPVYQRTLKKEREKIAPTIIRLTDELMK